MEYKAEKNRSWQIASLFLTVAFVGGALAFAFTAA